MLCAASRPGDSVWAVGGHGRPGRAGRGPPRSPRSPTPAGRQDHRAVDQRGLRRPSPAPGSATAGLGLTPAVHTQRAVGNRRTRTAPRGRFSPRSAWSRLNTSTPASASSASASRERLSAPPRRPARCLGQHPAHTLGGAAGVAVIAWAAKSCSSASPSDAGVAGPDEHEREVLRPALGMLDVSSAMSRQRRTWLRSVTASVSDSKPIACSPSPGIGSVRETGPSATIRWSRESSSSSPLDSGSTASVPAVVGAFDVADHQVGVAQLGAQRDDHVAGVEPPPVAPGSSGV